MILLGSTGPIKGPAWCKGHCKVIAISVFATAFILSPFILYWPVVHFTRTRHVEALLTALGSPSADVPKILREIDGLDPESRQRVLASGEANIIVYFENQADADVDDTKGKHDFDAALKAVSDANVYYPDSAELMHYFQMIVQSKNTYILTQINQQTMERYRAAHPH